MSSSSESHGSHDFNAMTPPINSVSSERLVEHLSVGEGDYNPFKTLTDDEVTSAVTELLALRKAVDAAVELAARRAANTPVDGVERADMLVKLARIIARNIDDERYYSAAPFQRAADEILTLLSPTLPSQVVGVKELVWEKSNVAERWTASYAFGTFEITHYNDGYVWQRGICSERFASLEAAQNAVQADFNARIRSCITSPAAEAVGYVSTTTMAYLKAGIASVACSIYALPVSIHNIPLYPAPSASREVTDSGLAQRLNNAASIIEQWDAWEIGAANKPTVRLTVSASKLLREAAAALPERGM